VQSGRRFHHGPNSLWNSRFAARDMANQVANINPSTRENRAAEIRQRWWTAMNKACARQKAQFESKLMQAIALRKAARKALYGYALARAKQTAAH
jgi:hypothetical protein